MSTADATPRATLEDYETTVRRTYRLDHDIVVVGMDGPVLTNTIELLNRVYLRGEDHPMSVWGQPITKAGTVDARTTAAWHRVFDLEERARLTAIVEEDGDR